MRHILTTVFVFALFSCKEVSKKDEATLEVSQEDITHSTAADSSEALLPTYNFDAFEKKYLQKENDSVYVINFWATWCKPCVKELPEFEKLNKDYSAEKVKVVLVSLDFPDKVEKSVIPFIKDKNLKSEVILLDDPDANSWIPKVSEEWSGAIPATIIVKGEKQKFFEKSFTYNELEREVKSI